MKIIFTGDFSVSGIFKKKINQEAPIIDNRIINIFNEAHFVNINLENPITNNSFRKKKGISLCAPHNTIKYLKSSGVNICTLANNHIMDCGYDGLKETIDQLIKNDILFYGIGGFPEYVILNKNGIKIALFASCHNEGPIWEGDNPSPFCLSIKKIKKIVESIKSLENPDYIVYSYHGGTEYNKIPEPSRREFFHKIVKFGVDVIIGHHAHVPQGIEIVDKSLIVYGLGNFCFDIKPHYYYENTNASFFISISFNLHKNLSYKLYNYKIDNNLGYIKLVSGEDNNNSIIEELHVFSSKKNYLKNWREEAFRIYFKPILSPTQKTSNNYPKGHLNINYHKKNTGKRLTALINDRGILLFLCHTFKYLLCDLLRKNRRPFLFGSIKYLIKGNMK